MGQHQTHEYMHNQSAKRGQGQDDGPANSDLKLDNWINRNVDLHTPETQKLQMG